MSRRQMILPEWEEYKGSFDKPTAVIFHTEFWEPQGASDTVDELIRELDSGGQFDPSLRAFSEFTWGAL